MKPKITFVLVFMLLSMHSFHVKAEVKTEVRTGTLVFKSHVFEEPKLQSKSIKILNANEAIKVHRRQRAWYNISSNDELLGWVKMLNIRFAGVMRRESEIGVLSLLSSTRSSNLPTVSTGVRGFDEEDLKKAKANIKQIEILNSYVVQPENLLDFIREGRLFTNNIIVKEKTNQDDKAGKGDNR